MLDNRSMPSAPVIPMLTYPDVAEAAARSLVTPSSVMVRGEDVDGHH